MGVTVSINVPISVPIRRWQKSPAIIKSLPDRLPRSAFPAARSAGKTDDARGYMVGPNGPVNLQIIVSRCMLTCPRATCATTSLPKRIRHHRYRAEWQQNDQKLSCQLNVEGAFQASNKNIADAVNSG